MHTPTTDYDGVISFGGSQPLITRFSGEVQRRLERCPSALASLRHAQLAWKEGTIELTQTEHGFVLICDCDDDCFSEEEARGLSAHLRYHADLELTVAQRLH